MCLQSELDVVIAQIQSLDEGFGNTTAAFHRIGAGRPGHGRIPALARVRH